MNDSAFESRRKRTLIRREHGRINYFTLSQLYTRMSGSALWFSRARQPQMNKWSSIPDDSWTKAVCRWPLWSGALVLSPWTPIRVITFLREHHDVNTRSGKNLRKDLIEKLLHWNPKPLFDFEVSFYSLSNENELQIKGAWMSRDPTALNAWIVYGCRNV